MSSAEEYNPAHDEILMGDIIGTYDELMASDDPDIQVLAASPGGSELLARFAAGQVLQETGTPLTRNLVSKMGLKALHLVRGRNKQSDDLTPGL
jgi:hypothetical protein